MKNFPNKLYQIRTHFQYSQVEMAKLLKIAPPSYYNLEKGKRNPALNTVVALARKLNINLNWLLLDEGEMLRE